MRGMKATRMVNRAKIPTIGRMGGTGGPPLAPVTGGGMGVDS